MFQYDAVLAASVQRRPQSIVDVLRTLRAIDAACAEGDGLKWFNGLYLDVTEAVQARVNAGGFAGPAWLAELDVQFAQLYFTALASALAGSACPGSWAVMFACRDNRRIARIQFALAGINAHINRDLPEAIVATCKVTQTAPRHGTPQYHDYTELNATLDTLINVAKRTLNVRLLGDPLPDVSHLEDLIAAWDVRAAREKAWKNAEALWSLPAPAAAGLIASIDGLTTVVGKALLVPVP
jgi:hypothetical protein